MPAWEREIYIQDEVGELHANSKAEELVEWILVILQLYVKYDSLRWDLHRIDFFCLEILIILIQPIKGELLFYDF